MNPSNVPGADRFLASGAAILSAPVAFVALYFYLAPLSFDLQALHRSQQVLSLGDDAIRSIRLGLLGDALGYYLLYIPLIAYWRRRLHDANGARSCLLDTASICGLLYVAFGVIGVVLQASVLPVLADGYIGLDAASRSSRDAAWSSIAAATLNGFWFFECALIAVWLLVIGYATVRRRAYSLGMLALTAGLAYGGAFIAGFDQLTSLSRALQMLALVLVPVWTFLIGISWWREARGVG